jgi:hypothetical protein
VIWQLSADSLNLIMSKVASVPRKKLGAIPKGGANKPFTKSFDEMPAMKQWAEEDHFDLTAGRDYKPYELVAFLTPGEAAEFERQEKEQKGNNS